MITPYVSQQPVNDFGLRFPGLLYGVTLAASAEQHFTVPGVAPYYKVVFSYSVGSAAADVWVAFNATSALPGSSIAAITGELNPVCHEVKAGDVLSFKSAGTPSVGFVFYALQTPN